MGEHKIDIQSVPKFPRDTTQQVQVKQWKDRFQAFLGFQGLRDIQQTGKCTILPHYILTQTDKPTRKTLEDNENKTKNGKLFNLCLISVETTAPHLFKTLNEKTYIDPSKPEKALGLGHLAFKYLCSFADNEASDAYLQSYLKKKNELLLKKGSDKMSPDDFEKRLNDYDVLNESCGKYKAKSSAVTEEYMRLLPDSLKGSGGVFLMTLRCTLKEMGIMDSPHEARNYIINDVMAHHCTDVKIKEEEGEKQHPQFALSAEEMMEAMYEMVQSGATERVQPYLAAAALQHRPPQGLSGRVTPRMWSQQERTKKLLEKDPCGLCKLKHFGGNGAAVMDANGQYKGCFGDPLVPLPTQFDKVIASPVRRKYIMALRNGERPSPPSTHGPKAMAAEECEPCDEYACLEDVIGYGDACLSMMASLSPASDIASSAVEPPASTFADSGAASNIKIDPVEYENLLRDVTRRGADTDDMTDERFSAMMASENDFDGVSPVEVDEAYCKSPYNMIQFAKTTVAHCVSLTGVLTIAVLLCSLTFGGLQFAGSGLTISMPRPEHAASTDFAHSAVSGGANSISGLCDATRTYTSMVIDFDVPFWSLYKWVAMAGGICLWLMWLRRDKGMKLRLPPIVFGATLAALLCTVLFQPTTPTHVAMNATAWLDGVKDGTSGRFAHVDSGASSNYFTSRKSFDMSDFRPVFGRWLRPRSW